MNSKKLLGLIALSILIGGGCETVKTTSAGAVGVDRKQQMLVPSAQIEQGAAEAYEAELKAARDKGVLNTDKAQLAANIRRDGNRELAIDLARLPQRSRRVSEQLLRGVRRGRELARRVCMMISRRAWQPVSALRHGAAIGL